MEKAHLFLDGVNLVADGPFAPVGALAGVVDAGLYLYEGKRFDAGAVSFAGTLPLIGAELSPGRLGSRAARLGEFGPPRPCWSPDVGQREISGPVIKRPFRMPSTVEAKEKPFEVFLEGAWQSRRADSVTMVAGPRPPSKPSTWKIGGGR